MARNGTVCQAGSSRIAARLSATNPTQAMSSQDRWGHWMTRRRSEAATLAPAPGVPSAGGPASPGSASRDPGGERRASGGPAARGAGSFAVGGRGGGRVDVGAQHLCAREVVVEVEDGAGFGGDHRVPAEAELIVLLLLARQGPVGGALHRVDTVDDHDLQVRDRV